MIGVRMSVDHQIHHIRPIMLLNELNDRATRCHRAAIYNRYEWADPGAPASKANGVATFGSITYREEINFVFHFM
jgi:hypothetical protein